MKKNTMEINIRQNPILYISFTLKSTIGFFEVLFSKNLGKTADPIKKKKKAIAIVMIRLVVSLFRDKIRNIANTRMTINGEKIYLLITLFLLRKPKKFSEGYNPLK